MNKICTLSFDKILFENIRLNGDEKLTKAYGFAVIDLLIFVNYKFLSLSALLNLNLLYFT